LRLLIVRHARAAPRGIGGIPDDERPLTRDGAADFGRAARGLARISPPPDLALTSPLRRARETAEIARAAWKSKARMAEERVLAGGATDDVVEHLAKHRGLRLVAVFGHEPGVSALLAHLVGAKRADSLAFKKGGVALVETLDPRSHGSGRLIWFLPPKVLAALGGGR